MEELLPFSKIQTIKFNRRPIPLPIEFRPIRQFARILLVLKLNSINSTASILKLHVFLWSLKSKANMDQLINFVHGKKEERYIFPNLDPAVNRACRFIVAEGYANLEHTGKLKITDLGSKFMAYILKDPGLLMEERLFLMKIKKTISDTKIENMMRRLS